MSTVSVASVTIPNFKWPVGSGTVYLRIYANAEFVTTAEVPIQPGNPLISGSWYKQLTCSLAGTDLTIPGFTIDSTTDALDRPGRSATYSAYFYLGNRQLGLYEGFESFRIVPQYSTNPATWALIRIDVANAVYVAPSLIDTYDRQTILQLIADAVSMSSGVSSINGQIGPAVTIAAGSTIGVVSGANTITISLAGPVAVADGGTGATTAAGARTALGAAASGANSDITSLTGLTTPLGAAFGGTGQLGGYTIGDLLYASGASAFSKRAAVATGQVLASAGVATAPAYTATPAVTSIKLSGLTAGRVVFAGAAGLLSDDSALLWDSTTDRLSIATTASDERINLANAGYLGVRDFAGVATKKLIGLDASDVLQLSASASKINIGGQVVSDLAASADFSGGDSLIFSPFQNTPTASWLASRGTYTTNGAGNNFHLSSYATTSGTRPTVAVFGQAVATAAGGQAFGMNPVAYCDTAGASPQSVAIEGNFGSIGTSASASAYGMVMAAAGDVDTAVNTSKAYIQLQVSTTAFPNCTPVNGIVFEGSVVTPVAAAGSLITLGGGNINVTTGVNMAGGTFAAGAFRSPAGLTNGYQSNDIGNSTSFNLACVEGSDVLRFGDTASALGGWRAYAASSVPFLAATPGASALPGNVGWNQTTPTAQHHVTSIPKRALTDNGGAHSLAANFGFALVTGTNTAFLTDLAPGSTLEISAQAGTYYKVLAIASDTSLTLTSNYGGTNTTTSTGKSDYRTLLIEGITGEDWLELSNQHTLKLYGNSTFSDLIGQFSLVNRANTAKRLTMGVDDTGTYAYISSFQESVGWKPLILQGGASQTDIGGVVIGQSTPSSLGAMLKVEGGGAKTANNVSTEFNNIATSVAYFQKISAQYLSTGSWVGPNFGIYTAAAGAIDASAEDWTNIGIGAFGGKNYFGPYVTQVTSPAPPTNLATAIVDVYGIPTDSITRGSDTCTTHATTTVDGSGTTWNTLNSADWVQPGDAVTFGTDTTVYEAVAPITDVALTLSASYAGTPAGGIEAHRDPYLLRLRNSYGTERFRVESNGKIVVSGASIQGARSKTLTESAATSFVTIGVASGSYVGGYVEYSIVSDDGVDYQCRSGILPFALVNKAGTETATIGTVTSATEVVAVSTGTLTNTFTADTTPTNGVSIQSNAVSSLTQTTLAIKYMVRITSGTAMVTPL